MLRLAQIFQTIDRTLNTQDFRKIERSVLEFDKLRSSYRPNHLRLLSIEDVEPYEIDLKTIPLDETVNFGTFRPWSLDVDFVSIDEKGVRSTKHIDKNSLQMKLIERIKKETAINGWTKFVNTVMAFRLAHFDLVKDLIPFRILAHIIKSRNGETFDENERGEILFKGPPPYNSLMAVQLMMCMIATENILSYKLGDISDAMKNRIEELVNELLLYVIDDPFEKMSQVKEYTTLLKTMGFELSTSGKKIVWNMDLEKYNYANHSFSSTAWSAFYDLNKKQVTEELSQLRKILPKHAEAYQFLLSAEVNRDNLTLFTYLHFPDSLIGFNRTNTVKDAAETLKFGAYSPEKEEIPCSRIYDLIYKEMEEIISQDLKHGGRSIFPNTYDFNKMVMTELKNTASGSVNLKVTNKDFDIPMGVKMNLRTKAAAIIKNYDKLTFESYRDATTFESPGVVGFRVVRGMKKGRGIENVPVEQSVVDSILKRIMDVMSHIPYYTNGKTEGSLSTDHHVLYFYSSNLLFLKLSTDFTRMDTTATTGLVRIPMFRAIMDTLNTKAIAGLPVLDYEWNGHTIREWFTLMFQKKRLAYYSLKYKPEPEDELYQYFDEEREILIIPLAMNYSGEATTNIINNLVSNAVQVDYLDVLTSASVYYNNQPKLSSVVKMVHREILGDDGMIIFNVSRQLKYNELFAIGDIWDKRTSRLGMISNINKLIISYIKIEYLKKLFILGYHIPRKHQLDIITREKKFGNLFVIEKFSALLQYIISMYSRGYPYRMMRPIFVALWLLDRRMKTENKDTFYYDFFALLTPKSLGGVGFCPYSRFSSSTDATIYMYNSNDYLFHLRKVGHYIKNVQKLVMRNSVISKIRPSFSGFNDYVTSKMLSKEQVAKAVTYQPVLIEYGLRSYSLLNYGKRAAKIAIMSNVKDNNLGKITANYASSIKPSNLALELPPLVKIIKLIKFSFSDIVVKPSREMLTDISGLTNDLYEIRTLFGITSKKVTDLSLMRRYQAMLIDFSAPRDIGIDAIFKIVAPYVIFGADLDIAIKMLIAMGFDQRRSERFVHSISREGSLPLLYSNLVNYSFNEPTLNDLKIDHRVPFPGVEFPQKLLQQSFYQYVHHMFIFMFVNQHPPYRKIIIESSEAELDSIRRRFRREALGGSGHSYIKGLYASNLKILDFMV